MKFSGNLKSQTAARFYPDGCLVYYLGEMEMKKLWFASFLILLITVVVFLLWHFLKPFPDWLVRVNGIVMMAAIFTFVFSFVRTKMGRK